MPFLLLVFYAIEFAGLFACGGVDGDDPLLRVARQPRDARLEERPGRPAKLSLHRAEFMKDVRFKLKRTRMDFFRTKDN